MCKLTIIQIIIEPFLCQQFLMISLLNDRTIFHNQNPIRILNRRKSMCHNKTGAPFHQFCKCILNFDLRSGINGRCRLIQNQHRRLAEHNTRNGDQLLLSLRQTSAIFSDPGILSVGQTFDKSMRMAGFCRCDHFFLCRIRFSHADIFTNCTGF